MINTYSAAINYLKTKGFFFLLCFLLPISLFSQIKITEQDSLTAHYRFVVAASKGNVQEIKDYINIDININYRDANGATALFYAVDGGYLEIIKILLYNGADPNISTYDGYTPLMNASALGDFESAQLLLYNAKTKLNLYNVNNITALHYASYYGNFYIVDMLLYYGANTSISAMYYSSPLLLASYNGDTAISGLLIRAGNSVLKENRRFNSPLRVAIQEFDTLLLDLYLNNINSEEINNKKFYKISRFIIGIENNDALEKWLKTYPLDSLKVDNRTALLNYAQAIENPALISTLNNAGIKPDWKPIISSFQMKFSTSFNSQDYTSYLGVGIGESKYRLSLSARYGTRFKYIVITEKVDENTFYQYWERRHIIALNLRKSFAFNRDGANIVKPYVSLDFQYHFGDYRGMSSKISNHFHLLPEIGISYEKNSLLIDFGYQYANFDIYNISPHRINLGVGFKIPFYHKAYKQYILWM